MTTLKATRFMRAPREVAWTTVADVERYHEYAPNLSASHVVQGRGEGMRRSCADNAGRSWGEVCTLWDEGSAYRFEVDTKSTGYPYPIEELQGTWSVTDAPGGCLVTIEFVALPRYGVAGGAFMFVMRPWLLRICNKLLDAWQQRIEDEARANADAHRSTAESAS